MFACASAVAALRWLFEDLSQLKTVSIDLLEPAETVKIAIEQVSRLNANSALAISRSDPGDNLDLTRDTPVWAWVERQALDHAPDLASGHEEQKNGERDTRKPHYLSDSAITLLGGEGIGRILSTEQPAIYTYAKRLLEANLRRWLPAGQQITVTLILPEGRRLGDRTSNAAFGVVEGLSLLGTSGIAQPLSAPGQLEAYRQELQQKQNLRDCLVFCIGENGLDLAQSMGIKPDRLVKTANWLGSMLVEAGMQGIKSVVLFGYHGKLIKLAGGIFHTHHYVADGRQEILAAQAAAQGVPTAAVQTLLNSPTLETALQTLRELEQQTGGSWVSPIYGALAEQIDRRSQHYIQIHSGQTVQVGSLLFDRQRQVIICSKTAHTLLPLV